jgi:hypothetical protein
MFGELAALQVDGELLQPPPEIFIVDQAPPVARALGPGDPAFSPLERLVMAYTDDLVANVRAGDATFVPLLQALGVQQLQELTVTIGYYMMVCRFLETFGVDLEADPAGKALNLPGMAG